MNSQMTDAIDFLLFLRACGSFDLGRVNKDNFLLSTEAQRTPTISHITQEQIRDIGGQVDLDCSVHYASDFPVIWVCKLSIAL